MLNPGKNDTATKQKKRSASLPAVLVKSSLEDITKLNGFLNQQNAKLIQTKKQMLREDVFLSDHTVAVDDPRIKQSLEAMTRIRKRTGFDPTLMKNKGWAAKVSKDLALGLAKVDEIVAEKKKREVGCNRSMDCEKMLLQRRYECLKSKSSSLMKRNHQRSHSDSEGITNAYTKLHKSVGDLTVYIAHLEAQGGFIAPKNDYFECREENDNNNNNKVIFSVQNEDDEQITLRIDKFIKLPEIVKKCDVTNISSETDNCSTSETEQLKNINCSDKTHEKRPMKYRSPSLPHIQPVPKTLQSDSLKRSATNFHSQPSSS